MSHELNPTIHALYANALSGEFSPPTDQLHRVHTLGMLSIATFLKGEIRFQDFLDDSVPRHLLTHKVNTYTYTPSWAPAEVMVVSSPQDRVSISAMIIRAQNSEAVLSLANTTFCKEPAIYLNDGIMPCDLPYDENTKLHTTKAAQEFFDSLAV